MGTIKSLICWSVGPVEKNAMLTGFSFHVDIYHSSKNSCLICHEGTVSIPLQQNFPSMQAEAARAKTILAYLTCSVIGRDTVSVLLPQFINIQCTTFFRIISVTVCLIYVRAHGPCLSFPIYLTVCILPPSPFLWFTPGKHSIISLL